MFPSSLSRRYPKKLLHRGGLTHPTQSKQDGEHLQHGASSDRGGPHSCPITGEMGVLSLFPGQEVGDSRRPAGLSLCSNFSSPLHLSRL